jgi:hypothetical protein
LNRYNDGEIIDVAGEVVFKHLNIKEKRNGEGA